MELLFPIRAGFLSGRTPYFCPETNSLTLRMLVAAGQDRGSPDVARVIANARRGQEGASASKARQAKKMLNTTKGSTPSKAWNLLAEKRERGGGTTSVRSANPWVRGGVKTSESFWERKGASVKKKGAQGPSLRQMETGNLP